MPFRRRARKVCKALEEKTQRTLLLHAKLQVRSFERENADDELLGERKYRTCVESRSAQALVQAIAMAEDAKSLGYRRAHRPATGTTVHMHGRGKRSGE